MPSEPFTLTSAEGHELSGALELPTGLVRGGAVFAHCFTCTRASRAAVSVARALAARGIACLRFDFTGLGASEGEFGRAGFPTDVSDLVAAASAVKERVGAPVLLVGHSLGGAAALAAAAQLGSGSVAALATIAAPSDVAHALGVMKGDHDAILRDGEGEVSIGGRSFRVSRAFLERTEATSLLDLVREMRVPFLALHSPSDPVVGIDHASRLFEAAYHPKSFVSLAGADHLLTRGEDAEFAADMIASWAGRYLPLRADWPMPEEGVVVQTGHGRFGTEVHTATHRFVADEPRSHGGEDSGPTPYDLLLAALGTCTAMTMKMYADRKKWPFEGTRIHLTHDRNHEQDCEHAPEEEGARMEALNREIELLGDALTEDQRARIMEIADKCPVHRTLEGHLHIHTRAAGDAAD
ncbi:MAG: alpha/beta fold hydrolase [Erythrobacter sp.]|uniref:bifunctional alpha/beta hydrolase/OsmC family protein n=1 Tax=Erythrobacter sp. HL-111 TaxID=1798193 RepID=UPI0006D944C9|nr:bifunctional alpha/beta hydrolase/OsmC family protein [Erythrobacter sp. HL-111]KPP86399.1 MAG: putative redox protein YhfA [Erythrobacteraceae bacterium HL-111]SDR93718.1 putative redox protein [Erythrobacter sp. HL-111]